MPARTTRRGGAERRTVRPNASTASTCAEEAEVAVGGGVTAEVAGRLTGTVAVGFTLAAHAVKSKASAPSKTTVR